MKEMWVAGVTVDPITKSPIVILRDRDSHLALPIWIGALEANAIVTVMERMELSRPMTHDLMRSILESADTSLRMVEIAEIRDNIYYALLHLSRDNERFAMDCRPSDAIALALRCCAPIMVSPEVLEHALPMDNLDDMPQGRNRQTGLIDKMDPEQFSKYKM